MKPEEILEKTLKGELSGESLEAEVGKLTVEQQAELQRLAKESAKTSLSEASGLRKERDRANEMKTQAEKDADEAAKKAEDAKKAAETAGSTKAPQSSDTMSQFRVEQKEKAINRLKAEMNLTDEQTAKVVEHFDKIDSGKVDADNILEELRGSYAFVNRDVVLKAASEQRSREQAAEAENAAAAGGASGSAPSGTQPQKFSEGVKKLAKEANITPEAAQKVSDQGTKRVYE